MELTVNIWTILIASSLTALVTGLGVIPFIFFKNFNRWWLSIFQAAAAGLMLGASHNLIQEGAHINPFRTFSGMLLGLILIVLANRLISNRSDVDLGDLEGGDARKALLVLGIMTAHSFAEGIGVGVSFGGGEKLGLFITAAIAIHNIPEGLAVALVMVPKGTKIWKAGFWSIFTSLPQPLMAIPAFLFVTFFTPWLPVGLGLAAGAMIWMVFAELIPDAYEGGASGAAIGIAVTLAFAALLAFQEFVLVF
ncbi:MAG TPA: ZIP family metal transporter [Chloroflexi bacterium]|nr:MAG: ZIP family metal transporter [Chloroflexota bacterium]HDN04789.1 ZIP family metal transporter [Chloroflexota bacterium]